MRNERKLSYGVALLVLGIFAFLGWARLSPAVAQDAQPVAQDPQPPRGMRMGGPGSIAATSDYVYVSRGNTLYQMKTSDLTLVKQQDLPAMGAPGNPPANPGNGQ